MRALTVALLALLAPASCGTTRDAPLRYLDQDGVARDPFALADRRGVALLFVRTDCPISNRYAPALSQIHATFAPLGIDFWAVHPDGGTDAAAARAHLAEYGLPFGALLDPAHRLVDRAGATVMPQAALFDRAGRLLYSGRIDDRFIDFGIARAEPTRHELLDALESLLEGKEPPCAHAPAIGCLIADLASPPEAHR